MLRKLGRASLLKMTNLSSVSCRSEIYFASVSFWSTLANWYSKSVAKLRSVCLSYSGFSMASLVRPRLFTNLLSPNSHLTPFFNKIHIFLQPFTESSRMNDLYQHKFPAWMQANFYIRFTRLGSLKFRFLVVGQFFRVFFIIWVSSNRRQPHDHRVIRDFVIWIVDTAEWTIFLSIHGIQLSEVKYACG